MSYRINSTGRKRILREWLRLRIFKVDSGAPPSFTADIQFPSEFTLDPRARVYVEPYVGSSSMRFDFGTVSRLVHPEACVLTDIDVGANILFRVKVVDESSDVGRILASADGVNAERDSDGDDRKPLLPLRTEDLAEEVWRLSVDKDGGPVLILNNRIPEVSERLMSDALMQGVIYPEVVRQLARLVYAESFGADEEAEWLNEWKNWFAEQIGRSIEDDELSDVDSVVILTDVTIPEAFATKRRYASLITAALNN